MVKAAILERPGQPLRVADLDVMGPKAGEVLVRVEVAGACHSDLNYMMGYRPVPLPVVLGHEGAGVVESVGEAVKSVRPGDHVVLIWRAACGLCDQCKRGRPVLCRRAEEVSTRCLLPDGTSRLSEGGHLIHQFDGIGAFAQYCVVMEESVVPIDPGIPFEVAALMGCSVVTGVSAVFNTDAVTADSTVLVSGCGPVGLSCILGAQLKGAKEIVASDVVAARLETARRLGATQTILALPDGQQTSSRGGTAHMDADVAFEASGVPSAMVALTNSVRPGGTIVIIGLQPDSSPIPIPQNAVVANELTIKGCLYGSSDPRAGIQALAGRFLRGDLPIGELIGSSFGLDQIDAAYADLLGGRVGRNLVIPGRLS